MDRVLLISGSDKVTSAITSMIKNAYPQSSVNSAATGGEARRTISENEYDAIIVNCPLSDEFGTDLAEHISATTNSFCLMLVKAEDSEQIAASMEDYGIMVLSKPLGKDSFYRALRFLNASRKRMLGLQNENIKLHKKLEEMRIINRAKFALMQYLSFSEAQAHRYIEKQAMDTRSTKLEVAKTVIKTYET